MQKMKRINEERAQEMLILIENNRKDAKLLKKMKKRYESQKQKSKLSEEMRMAMTDEHNFAIQQLAQMQKQISYFQEENQNLKADINLLVKKSEVERIEREELEQVPFLTNPLSHTL